MVDIDVKCSKKKKVNNLVNKSIRIDWYIDLHC